MADAAEVAGLKQLIHRFCCMSLTSKRWILKDCAKYIGIETMEAMG
jgi:hypothetical protein